MLAIFWVPPITKKLDQLLYFIHNVDKYGWPLLLKLKMCIHYVNKVSDDKMDKIIIPKSVLYCLMTYK